MKVVIFDFDGTILDTLPILLRNMKKVCKELNLKNVKFNKKMRDKSLKEIVKELKIPFYKVPTYAGKLKELIKPEIKKGEVFPGIKEVISELRKKCVVGILSSNLKETVKYVLDKNKIKVDFIYSDKSIFGKHIILKRLLKKKNFSKKEVIYVGDEIRDVEASKKIGIKIIAVSWGFNSEKALKKAKADIIATNVKDLLSFFE